eukprot:6211483-Pleurochrysis_carterae.AAC.3
MREVLRMFIAGTECLRRSNLEARQWAGMQLREAVRARGSARSEVKRGGSFASHCRSWAWDEKAKEPQAVRGRAGERMRRARVRDDWREDEKERRARQGKFSTVRRRTEKIRKARHQNATEQSTAHLRVRPAAPQPLSQ